jgi:hypothetical protein
MPKSTPRKGRGASFNPHPRYLGEIREVFDDGWTEADERLPPFSTTVTVKQARTIISRNHSPDDYLPPPSTLTGAVSTAVSTATPTRPTPIWIYRLSSILSANSLPKPMRRSC